jgi:hypothetical protein
MLIVSTVGLLYDPGSDEIFTLGDIYSRLVELCAHLKGGPCVLLAVRAVANDAGLGLSRDSVLHPVTQARTLKSAHFDSFLAMLNRKYLN